MVSRIGRSAVYRPHDGPAGAAQGRSATADAGGMDTAAARPTPHTLIAAVERMGAATDPRDRRSAIEDGAGHALALARGCEAAGSGDHALAYRAIAERLARTPATQPMGALTERVRLAVRLLDAPDGPARVVRTMGGMRLIPPRPPA